MQAIIMGVHDDSIVYILTSSFIIIKSSISIPISPAMINGTSGYEIYSKFIFIFNNWLVSAINPIANSGISNSTATNSGLLKYFIVYLPFYYSDDNDIVYNTLDSL